MKSLILILLCAAVLIGLFAYGVNAWLSVREHRHERGAKRKAPWILPAAMLCLLGLLIGGCGVVMNATYSQLLDQTAALAADSATRAEANALTTDQMKTVLRSESDAWQSFRNARDGRANVAK